METQQQKQQKQQPSGTSASKRSSVGTTPLFFQKHAASVRQALTPYLPPPVVKAVAKWDSQLEPHVGPEGTMTLIVTLFLAYTVIQLLRLVAALTARGKGKAIADEDDDDQIFSDLSTKSQQYDATVLLCGPMNAGKTRLFYQLCFGNAAAAANNLPTLMSLKANVGVSSSTVDTNNQQSQQRQQPVVVLRYMDWPGYASLTDPSLSVVLQSPHPLRIVLVVDSTAPMASAADVLCELLDHAATTFYQNKKKSSNSSTSNANAATTTILVACHKSDLPKAKNPRRIKLQLRTELERLIVTKKAKMADSSNDTTTTTTTSWWPAGTNTPTTTTTTIDLDDLEFCKLHFVSTTSEKRGGSTSSSSAPPALISYCQTGQFPTAYTPAAASE